MSVKDLFIELIKVSVGKLDRLSETPAPVQWEQICRQAVRQAIDVYLVDALGKLPPEQIAGMPEEVKYNWIGIALNEEGENMELQEKSEQALKFFRDKGFRCVVLKGAGMARFYPEPGHRTVGDIDIWVDADRRSVYEFALSTSGKVDGVNYFHIHYHLFDNPPLELHFMPSYLSSPLRNARLKKFSRLHAPDNSADYPSLEFNRVYILMHCFRHLCGHGVGLKQVLDYYYVLQQGFTEDERAQTMAWLKRLGLATFAGAMMWVLKEICGLDESLMLCRPDEKEGRFFLSEVMQTGNMGFYDSRVSPGAYSTPLRRFLSSTKRNLHMLTHYPIESFWAPLFNIWVYFYNLMNHPER